MLGKDDTSVSSFLFKKSERSSPHLWGMVQFHTGSEREQVCELKHRGAEPIG